MLTWADSNLQRTTKHISHSYFSLGPLVLIMFIKFSFSALIEEPINTQWPWHYLKSYSSSIESHQYWRRMGRGDGTRLA